MPSQQPARGASMLLETVALAVAVGQAARAVAEEAARVVAAAAWWEAMGPAGLI